MRKIFFCLAIIGWTLGLTVHLLSIVDFDVSARFPFVWVLHLGIFVVFIPAILYHKKNKGLEHFWEFEKTDTPGSVELDLEHAPKWLQVIAWGGAFYAALNFVLFLISQDGSPTVKDGQFILENHGKLIKILTEQEYHHYLANQLRGFSGHWMAFYGFAAAALYPPGKNTHANQDSQSSKVP